MKETLTDRERKKRERAFEMIVGTITQNEIEGMKETLTDRERRKRESF